MALTLLTVILESVLKCALQTPTTGRDGSYKLNVVAEGRSGGYSEIMGGYRTLDTMVEIGA